MFSELVRSHRRRLGLTQEELATSAGLNVRSLRKIEAGRVGMPRQATVRSLADAFELTGFDREDFCQRSASELGRSAAIPPVPAQLPADMPTFTGRLEQLARLDAVLAGVGDRPTAVVVSALSGTAGVGKTALALRWAHRVANRFPDGQLYVNMRGFDIDDNPMEPGEAIRCLLDALAVPPLSIPATLDAQAGLYRSLLARKRILVVLDNARDAEQVRPLLTGGPFSTVVVTSRDSLAGLVAREGANRLHVDVLSLHEAVSLLRTLIGSRVEAEPRAAAELADLCARLPLALRVCAELAAVHPSATLSQLVSQLVEKRQRLELLDAGGDPRTGVRPAFSWSYRRLTPAATRLFRLLGLHPGPDISMAAAASLAALPLHEAHLRLRELARAHVLAEHTLGRYSFHDLLRAYATELTDDHDPDEERRAAVVRMLDHYTHTAHTAAGLLYPQRDPIAMPLAPPAPGTHPEQLIDSDEATRWFTMEQPVLLSVVRLAAKTGFDTHTWQLAWGLDTYMDLRGHWHGLTTVWHAGLSAARHLQDLAGQAIAHACLAHAETRLGHHEAGQTHLAQAIGLSAKLGDLAGQAHAHPASLT